MAIQNKAAANKNLDSIRKTIANHKRHDFIFASLGTLVIASLTITLLILFLDLVIDGYPRFNLDFFSNSY